MIRPLIQAIIAAMLLPALCQGQPIVKRDTMPHAHVYFEDDYSHNAVGAFPSGWHISANADTVITINKQYCQVKKESDGYVLAVSHLKNERGLFIEPDIEDSNPLPKSFNLEYDFVLENKEAEISLEFCSKPSTRYCSDLLFSIANENGGISLEQFKWHEGPPRKKEYPAHTDFSSWHHVRLNFDHGNVKCFIDQYRMSYFSEANYYPKLFLIGFDGPLKLKHFRISSTDSSTDFSTLLTENKFVTHAILFDVNQSTIKQESMGFIAQLAAFLTKNPQVKMEIDGHTDSEGNAAANMQLSKARAEAVKKQLTALGIAGSRLTTKGFGATKPLQLNTSAEGKANNRRVEFIKL